MKRTPSLRRPPNSSGFTLVELLVVMAIIAILAGVLFAAGGGAIRSAKRVKAANMANQLQTAVLTYYTEYNVYPIPSTVAASTEYSIADKAANAADWGNLIKGLCGNINPYTGLAATSTVANTRAIPFLSLKKADVDVNVAPLNPLPTGDAIYFNIAMDGDYDGVLGVGTSTVSLPNLAAATTGTAPATSGGSTTAGVAVWVDCNSKTTTKNPAFWQRTY